MTNKILRCWCLGVIGVGCALLGSASTLTKAYQDAYHFDPLYQQAHAHYQLDQRAVGESAAVFFPQITGAGSLYSNDKRQDTNDFSVNVNQTVFNWGYFKQISKARAVVRLSVYQFSAAQQDLIRRFVAAYLQVVRSEALEKVAKQQYDNIGKQVHAVRERYKLGHSTVTDLDRVMARNDLYRAELITAKI